MTSYYYSYYYKNIADNMESDKVIRYGDLNKLTAEIVFMSLRPGFRIFEIQVIECDAPIEENNCEHEDIPFFDFTGATRCSTCFEEIDE